MSHVIIFHSYFIPSLYVNIYVLGIIYDMTQFVHFLVTLEYHCTAQITF